MGLEPDENLAPNQAAALADYIRMTYALAYEWYEWPEAVVNEKRLPVDQVIEWSEGGDTDTFGTVFSVTEKHPLKEKNPIGVKFRLGSEGIYLPSTHATTEVYVNYRVPAPDFTSAEYAAGTAYAAGETVYYATTGECYEARQATTGNLPTDANNWKLLPLLSVIADATVQGALSEAMAEEGQHTAGQTMDAKFEGYLEHELDRLIRQSGQSRMIRMDDFNVN